MDFFSVGCCGGIHFNEGGKADSLIFVVGCGRSLYGYILYISVCIDDFNHCTDSWRSRHRHFFLVGFASTSETVSDTNHFCKLILTFTRLPAKKSCCSVTVGSLWSFTPSACHRKQSEMANTEEEKKINKNIKCNHSECDEHLSRLWHTNCIMQTELSIYSSEQSFHCLLRVARHPKPFAGWKKDSDKASKFKWK